MFEGDTETIIHIEYLLREASEYLTELGVPERLADDGPLLSVKERIELYADERADKLGRAELLIQALVDRYKQDMGEE